MNFNFFIIKEGGQEGIVIVDESPAKLKKLEESEDCQKLSSQQLQALNKKYPPPKLKKKYRTRWESPKKGAEIDITGKFETDEKGKPIIDTYQTVRCGFYLIDILVVR